MENIKRNSRVFLICEEQTVTYTPMDFPQILRQLM